MEDMDELEIMEEIKLKKKNMGSDDFKDLLNKSLTPRQMDELFLDHE